MNSNLYPDLATACRALYLKDIEVLPVSAYRDIVAFHSVALAHDYPVLR